MRILSLSLALLPLSFGAVRLGQARQDRLVQVEVETVRRRSVDLTILSPSSNDLTCPSCSCLTFAVERQAARELAIDI